MKRMTVVPVLCFCLAVGGSYLLGRSQPVRWFSTSPPGEVSGPLSAHPFIIEPPAWVRPTPCDPPPAVGCDCCSWAPGTESGSDCFDLYRMSDLRNLHSGYAFECDQACLVSNHAQCCYPNLALGQVVGWLVRGVNSAGGGILGTDSQGNPIPAAVTCP